MRVEPTSNRPLWRTSQEASRLTGTPPGARTSATDRLSNVKSPAARTNTRDVSPSASSTKLASSKLVTPYQKTEPRSPGNTPQTEAAKLATLARSLSMQSDRDPASGLPGPDRQQVRLQQEQNISQSNPRSTSGPSIVDVAAKLLTIDVPAGNKNVTIRTPVASATFEAERRIAVGNGDLQLRPAEQSVAAQVRFDSRHSATVEASRSRGKESDVSAGIEAETVLSHQKISSPRGSTRAAQTTEQKTFVSAGVTTGEGGKVWSVYAKGTMQARIDEAYKVEQTAKITISQDPEQVRNTLKAGAAASVVYGISRALSRAGVGVIPMLPGHYVLETGGF